MSLGARFDALDREQRMISEAGGNVAEASSSLARRWMELYAAAGRDGALPSRNEELDDVATSTLRLLAAPYYVAALHEAHAPMDERLSLLKLAQGFATRFLDSLAQLGILPARDRDAWRQRDGATADAARSLLVERARDERRLAETLERLERGLTDADDADREPVLRELWVARLQLLALKAFALLRSVDRELPMLEMMRSGGEARAARAGEDGDSRTRQNSPFLASAAAAAAAGPPPISAVRLQSRGHGLQQQVFRPGWNQPLMSVEQAGEIEFGISQRASAEQQERARLRDLTDPKAIAEREGRYYEEEDDNAWVADRRRWDSFKDDNPTGWGNRINQG